MRKHGIPEKAGTPISVFIIVIHLSYKFKYILGFPLFFHEKPV
jgi:hypothetical protein